jgi:hypothetical protein
LMKLISRKRNGGFVNRDLQLVNRQLTEIPFTDHRSLFTDLT